MTRKVLELLASGEPKTVGEMADELGIAVHSVRYVVAQMRQAGYVESRPATYAITDVGMKRKSFKPKTAPKEIAKRVEKRREKRNFPIINSVFSLASGQ